MKPARLISVAGSAFGSLVEPFEVVFPESGLIHLRGENLDTKGSSASGDDATTVTLERRPQGASLSRRRMGRVMRPPRPRLSLSLWVVEGREEDEGGHS